MDNNQPNPWQSGQNPGQSATPTWGASANPGGGYNQPNVGSGAAAQSPVNQPAPPSYQPPVSYGAIGNNATNSLNQAGANSVSSGFGAASFGSVASQPQPVQSSQPATPSQSVTNSSFQSNNSFQSQQVNPTGSIAPAQPIQPGQPDLNNSAQPVDSQVSAQSTPAKSKQPLSQNQVLFIITGLVSVAALAVIVICVVLVTSK